MKEVSVSFTQDDTKIAKAIGIILMFVHHLFAFPDRIASDLYYISIYHWKDTPIEYILGQYGKICVMLFVFLGGYGTYISCNHAADLTATLWQKIKKLYCCYWKVFLIFIPICMLSGVERVSRSFIDFLLNFSGLQTSYNGEWWFFTPYIVLILFCPILCTISRRFSHTYSEFIMILAVNTFVMFVLPTIPSTCSWAAGLPNSFVYQLFISMANLLPGFWMGSFFAKYDILSIIKIKFANSITNCIIAAIVATLTVYIRQKMGSNWDIILAPILIASTVVALNCKIGKLISKILLPIGKESTFCWLIHSFYCYHLLQRFVFWPKYSILIVILLIVLCLVTAKGITLLFNGLKHVQGLVDKYINNKRATI